MSPNGGAARRELQHGEMITCLQNGTGSARSVKFRSEDGVEGTWFPTDGEGLVPAMALQAVGPPELASQHMPQTPVEDTLGVDPFDTGLNHQPIGDPADTDHTGHRSKVSWLDRLKRGWRKATNGERIAFMEWVLREEAATEERERAARAEEED